MNRLSQWSIVHPVWCIGIALFFVLFASIGAKNLYFRGDYKVFFEQDDPKMLAYQNETATYSNADGLIIVLSPADGNIFTKKNLSLIRELTESAWLIPYSNRVSSVTNYQHTSAEDDDLVVEDLVPDYRPLNAKRIDYIRRIALSQPEVSGALVSVRGDVAAISVSMFLKDGDQTGQFYEATRYVERLLDDIKKTHPDVEFHLIGNAAINTAFFEAATSDATTLIPLMFITVTLFLTFMLASWRLMLATLLIIITTNTATLGLLGWYGHYLTNGTVNIPTLLMTLAIADCVHVITTYVHALREGKQKVEALTDSLSLNFMALLITSVTTAIGFLTMNASTSPVLSEFGNLAAIGVMIAFILSITLLPAILVLLPADSFHGKKAQQGKIMVRLADSVITHHKKLLPIGAVVVLLSAFALLKNEINDNPVQYFDSDNSFRQSAEYTEKRLSGMARIGVSVSSGKPQGITEPEFLRHIEEFTDWARQQPEIDHVSSITDIFKRLNRDMHGGDTEYDRLPPDSALAAQYLLLFELSLPYGLDLTNQLNIDKSSTLVSLIVKNLGSKELVALESRINEWFSSHTSSCTKCTVSITGTSLMFAHIGETNMISMLQTLPVVLVLISLLLIFALRSLRLGVISILPNAIPAVIGFGFWGMISGEINLGLSVVTTLTLGIVVDDSVHFLTKYRYARLKGDDVEQAIRFAFETVGRALWVTTLVLVAGFSVLASSSFRVNADMGTMSAIVIFIALVVDFLLLPAALLLFDRQSYSLKGQRENSA
ncbi:efflux RND transporter permease subunit [Veronia pacifica]|uniref:RND transporter n=1 Tax=Veronia pacifica TaxID=1080227 RepID=A0A1C3ERU8_9GAMM|nr:MMPL family transporter [Veronia pacifica]ODA35941.1 RND transporter [Veronia pacifica]